MSGSLWTEVRAGMFYSRRTHDRWIVDVWRTRKAGRWKFSWTDDVENTTRYVATFADLATAKATGWRTMQAIRAKAHNVVEVTL